MAAQLQALLDEQRALKCLEPLTNEGGTRAGGEGLVEMPMPGGDARPPVQPTA